LGLNAFPGAICIAPDEFFSNVLISELGGPRSTIYIGFYLGYNGSASKLGVLAIKDELPGVLNTEEVIKSRND
jgi:hypothetical protein